MEGVFGSTPSLLPLLTLLICFSAGKLTSAASPTDFIRSSCNSTQYPDLCVRCLSAYGPAVRRSWRQLAHAALTVSAARARSASNFVSQLSAGSKSVKSREGGAVRDCIENMSDSVDRLRQSVGELRHMGRFGSSQYAWRLSNMQTWVSAAITDVSTCLESLSEDGSTTNVRSAIRRKVVDVAQVISNALALVNQLGPRS